MFRFDQHVDDLLHPDVADEPPEDIAVLARLRQRDVIDKKSAHVVDDEREPDPDGIDAPDPAREARYLAQHEELAESYVETDPRFFGADARVVPSPDIVVEADRLPPAQRVPDEPEDAVPVPSDFALAEIAIVAAREHIEHARGHLVGAHGLRSRAPRLVEACHQRL